MGQSTDLPSCAPFLSSATYCGVGQHRHSEMCNRSLLFVLSTAAFAFLGQLQCFPAPLGKVHLLLMSFFPHVPGVHPLRSIHLLVVQFCRVVDRRAPHTFGLREANVHFYHTLDRMGYTW